MSKVTIQEVHPYLRVSDAKAAIEFYEAAFDAVEEFRLTDPNGRIGHAQLRLGDSMLMLADEYPEYGMKSPLALGGTGSSIHLQVSDVDALTKQAADAGAEVLREPEDQFYGHRGSMIRDPFGHEWNLGQLIEEVSHDEMQRRFEAMFSGGDGS